MRPRAGSLSSRHFSPGHDFMGLDPYFIPQGYKIIPLGYNMSITAANPRHSSDGVGRGVPRAQVAPGAT